jgi:hypothetical protein
MEDVFVAVAMYQCFVWSMVGSMSGGVGGFMPPPRAVFSW